MEKGNIYNDLKSDIKVYKVREHNEFKRNGLQLVLKKHITFKESLCGFKLI